MTLWASVTPLVSRAVTVTGPPPSVADWPTAVKDTGAPITTGAVTVVDSPSLSETVRVTVYRPSLAYERETVRYCVPDTVEPSPKFQVYVRVSAAPSVAVTAKAI